MKRALLLSNILLLGVIALTSCEDEYVSPLDNIYTTDSSGPTPDEEGFKELIVTVPDIMTVDESTSFEFTWEENDKFSVYKAEGDYEWVANFNIANEAATLKTFSVVGDTRLEDDVDYVAVYPVRKGEDQSTYQEYVAYAEGITSAQAQTGITASHLKDECYMEVEFNGDDPIAFAHKKAVAVVKFNVDPDTLTQTLKLVDGSSSYKITMNDMDAMTVVGGVYPAFMMINPASATLRTQSFYVPADAADATYTTEISTNYVAGSVYAMSTFSINSYDTLTITMPDDITNSEGSAISATLSANDIVSIYKKDGEWVTDCTMGSATSGTLGTSIDNLGSYVAVYPAKASSGQDTYAAYVAAAQAKVNSQTQTADNSVDHLKSVLWYEGTLSEDEVTLTHQDAVVCIKFTMDSAATLNSLTFVDGTKTYELALSGLTGATSYTAYLAVTPNDGTARDQSVKVIYDGSTEKKYTTDAATTVYAVGSLTTLDTADMTTTSVAEISTKEALLAYLASPTCDVMLTDDIDLNNETFTPATLSKEFNGNNKKISGLSSTKGLFSIIGGTGIVKNVELTAPKITGSTAGVGAIAGTVNEGGQVISCTITGGTITGIGSLGGVVGVVTGATISDCECSATVTQNSSENAGGIVGKATSTTISDCMFTGSFSGVKNGGGIAGYIVSTTVEDCLSGGSVTGSSNVNIGGVVGYALTSSAIYGCTNSSTISSASNQVGGILGIAADNDSGANFTVVNGCVNTGAITGGTKVAGIVGTFNGSGGYIVACYNTGSVAAGICSNLTTAGYIIGCYNDEGGTAVPPIANTGSADNVTDCYYIKEASAGFGTRIDDIEALNAVVETMNTAIKASAYTGYIFSAGTDTINDRPTIVENN
ncbi:MAG: hypothetical protein SNF68_02335 [Rikenellaceae bacterium]